MTYYGLHGKLKAVKGKGDELADILLEASRVVSSAKGCRLYVVSQDPGDNDAIWVTEIWDTEEDHNHSLKLESVRQLIGMAMPILDGPPEGGQKLKVIGGTGIGQ